MEDQQPVLMTEMEKTEQERQKICRSFFKNGKLVSIPVQQKKLVVVLKEIVKDFVPDRRYTEKEVNAIVSNYYDDFCTIRREIVDFHLMDRDKGFYWRI